MLLDDLPARIAVDVPAFVPVACVPERRLAAAVLEQALADLERETRRLVVVRRRGRPAYPREPARAWFRAIDEQWPFSFENVCAALGLDAGSIRRAVEGRGPAA